METPLTGGPGLQAASRVAAPWRRFTLGGRAGTGGLLSFLAAGCPVCNKLVVLAVGASGALAYYRPLQPLLGAVSVVLLGLALRARFRTRAGRSWPAGVQTRGGATAGGQARPGPAPGRPG